MKKLSILLYAVLAIASLAQAASAASIAEDNGWKPVFTVIPRVVDMRAVLEGTKTGKTLPTFTNTVEYGGKSYSFTIVGSDPTKRTASTIVKYFPIAIRWHFPGGVVIDPTKPGCNDSASVASRFFNGPLFTNVPNTSNGITLPKTQTTDAFQIAEFWKYTRAKNYHVLLSSTEKSITVVDETAPSDSILKAGACTGSDHDLGEIDINEYDTLLTAIATKYAKSASILPVMMSYNIVETVGGSCCIVGYHSVVTNRGEPQPYATGAYTDAGVFPPGAQDIWAWQREMGETFNNPYVNNAVPAWQNSDGVGCDSNLEVGAPLLGMDYELKENGFTYHPQELAFFSWFFRQNPSIGAGGKYSYKGTFSSAPAVCH